jgi:uncharacterized surface protein with fasciclin (FAS1) repeats
MNHHSIQSLAGHTGFRIVLLVLASMVFNTCVEEPQIWKVASQQQVIGDYITSHPEQFSEFGKLMESTGMEALLNTRGPFTLFLPTDEAMLEYYTYKNANSLADFTDSLLEELILYHTVGAEIGANDIGLGTLRETNAIGDFLVTEFDGSDIIVHKHSRIIDRDIRAANGYIHVIDRVIDPVTKDIYSVISSDPSYRIFSEGLSLTGLKDTLQLISFPYGKSMARTRFTVLAVADTIYQRYGIHDVQELIGWCGANPDSVTFLENPFYRYMEYHCLNNTYYLSDLETGIYPILSRDNNISFTIDTDYKINLDRKTDLYTGFNIPASNTPAKNGALHSITDILPVTIPEPAPITFETTDFFDLKQGDYYGHYYSRWWDGENTFANIKWKGEYLLYYFQPNNSDIMNHDCLSTLGWWSVSITFPKVMKGEYEVYIFQPNWHDVTNCIAYLDGVRTDYIYEGNYGGTGGTGGLQKMADANFTTTCEHTITLRNIVNGMLFWDYVVFEPVPQH